VAYDDVMLTAVTTNAATIRRKTYALGGQPVAMRAMALLTARLRPDNPHTQNVRRNFAALPGG
jgi:hypothetical protein